MNTEKTERPRGFVAYDGECGFCRRFARLARPILLRRNVHLVMLQSGWVPAAFRLPQHEVLGEMRFMAAGGSVFGGADAFIELARLYWWAWPAYWAAKIPGCHTVLSLAYRWVAKHRHSLGCNIPRNRNAAGRRHTVSRFYEMP